MHNRWRFSISLFSATLGRAALSVNGSSGTLTISASQNTTPQILQLKASSAITNLTLNKDGSSSFGTNAVSSGAITCGAISSGP